MKKIIPIKISSSQFSKIKTILFFICIASATQIAAQQKVIQLYNGVTPGSENWNWKEQEIFVKNPLNAKVAYNISKPTLTVFTPDSAKANGTAVIIFPGGGFHVLNIETEGAYVAKELNKKGITAFVLRYRVVQSVTDNPWQEMMSSMKDREKFLQKISIVSNMAKDDAAAAIIYVRQHAAAYKIDSKKIGIIGFSAGGGLAIQLSLINNESTRPDFAGFIYSVFNAKESPPVPDSASPVFIACATDDILASPSNSINLYNAWLEKKRPAELHIYAKGGHGLRAGNAGSWLNRFEEWLYVQGFINPKQ
ncbi:MAG: alpha/beta hydrolase [Chitinophagaceae bacterium]